MCRLNSAKGDPWPGVGYELRQAHKLFGSVSFELVALKLHGSVLDRPREPSVAFLGIDHE